MEQLVIKLEAQQLQIDALETTARRLDAGGVDPGDMDVFWLIFGGVLVFWMQAGFAMLEVGTVHRKNTKNILIKNMFDASIAAICWWAIGHALAGGGDSYTSSGNGGFAGDKGFFYHGKDDYASKGQAEAGWFFAWTFAGAAATIVSGAVAERCAFSGYLIYSAVLTSVIYPPVVHMMWGNGKFGAWRSYGKNGGDGALFSQCGVTDFAGSGVVHMTGGVAALVGAIMVGPRKGRFSDANYKLPVGNPVLQSLGVLILWMGWYGFNAVSTLYINGLSGTAAHVCFTTTISAATGCLTCGALGYAVKHEIDIGMVNNGILAGLVGITAGCPVVSIWGAFCIGFSSAFVYYGTSQAMKLAHIDDVVDAVAVHGACGAWGVIAVGFFSTPTYYAMGYYSERKDKCAGLFYGGTGASMKAALASIGVIFAWVGSTSTILFGALKVAGLLRVSEEVEEMGMDDSKHGGRVDLPDPVDAIKGDA
jgi:Amt family ammonium transporter